MPTLQERREHDELTNDLLRRAARLSGPDRQRAIQDVVVRNLGLAEAISRRYLGRGVDAEDLTQVASAGLVAAAQRFDADRGDDFVSFAVPTIVGEVKRYFRDHAWSVRPPRRVQELRSAMSAAAEEISQTRGTLPSPAELAAHLGADLTDVLEATRAADCYATVSLDHPALDSDGDGATLGDLLGVSDPAYLRVEAVLTMAAACRTLTERERRILYLRYFRGCTQQEIGDELGVTQMQVSRLIIRILRRLKKKIDTLEQSTASDQTAASEHRGQRSR
ncbi:SigB/SigF/SigG family RNA polymerase sigma factor [Jiangella anatolica]|uniref:RNA polymerase subunit sigma-70 n=1 Tax=Jiangella anatolica TaxID=2670374 RepID=A0A2W2BVC4_9ACTN|nr:SigB/SigF/SigG family RNA polymerase sigma factor [Jiangella anatolica]PZF84344.1 RNA polymerase subunit sigma-70 [Jiangella anatolica]